MRYVFTSDLHNTEIRVNLQTFHSEDGTIITGILNEKQYSRINDTLCPKDLDMEKEVGHCLCGGINYNYNIVKKDDGYHVLFTEEQMNSFSKKHIFTNNDACFSIRLVDTDVSVGPRGTAYIVEKEILNKIKSHVPNLEENYKVAPVKGKDNLYRIFEPVKVVEKNESADPQEKQAINRDFNTPVATYHYPTDIKYPVFKKGSMKKVIKWFLENETSDCLKTMVHQLSGLGNPKIVYPQTKEDIKECKKFIKNNSCFDNNILFLAEFSDSWEPVIDYTKKIFRSREDYV
jgi:hypothetical protein